MKKFAILACVMTVSAGLAIAETVSIPFFSDTNGNVAFVGLQNVSGGTITGSIVYTYQDPITAALTTESGGTFSLANGQSFSYRPFTAGGLEVQQPTMSDATVQGFGSITITTSGGPVAGRFVQAGSSGQFAHNVAVNP